MREEGEEEERSVNFHSDSNTLWFFICVSMFSHYARLSFALCLCACIYVPVCLSICLCLSVCVCACVCVPVFWTVFVCVAWRLLFMLVQLCTSPAMLDIYYISINNSYYYYYHYY